MNDLSRENGYGGHMARKVMIAVLVAGLAMSACGGSSDTSSSDTSSSDTSSSDTSSSDTSSSDTSSSDTSSSVSMADDDSPYPKYLELVEELAGDVISRDDAAIRASLLCSGSAKEMLGGVPISEFPTDLALIRAYCPEMESEYK